MDNIESKNPDWNYKELESDDNDYGGVTKHVFEHKSGSKAVRIGLSEGGHIMKCPAGSWQVTFPYEYNQEDRCFENELSALTYALGWVERNNHI